MKDFTWKLIDILQGKSPDVSLQVSFFHLYGIRNSTNTQDVVLHIKIDLFLFKYL